MDTAPSAAERIRLKGHQPISATTIHGWPAFSFGLPFIIAGLGILLVGLGKIDVSPRSIHAPAWVISVSGGAFLAAGVWLGVHGIRGIRRAWNMKQGKRRMPNSPWLWDYSWSARGATENKLRQALSSVVVLVIFSIFLAPFHWVAFASNQGGIFWKMLVGLFDVIVGLGLGSYVVGSVGRYLKFGNRDVEFQSFPFFLGGPCSLTLKQLPRAAHHFTLDLRCIEEVYEITRRGRHRRSEVVGYQLYKDSRTFQGKDLPLNGDLLVSWTLPDNKDLSSTPSERPARFWELEVTGALPGLNYQSRFILPIYAKPS